MKKLLLVFAFVPFLLFSQSRKQRKALEAQRKADQQVINNFKSHILFFRNNAEGVDIASKKDELIVNYISNQFKNIGLQPKGTNGYLQQFKIDEGKTIDAATFLKVNGATLSVKKDYFPLSFSASKSVTGMPAMALKEKGVPWFTDVKEWLEDDTTKADPDMFKTVLKEADRAASKGATALFLYNSSHLADNLRFNNREKTSRASIPVIYITSAGYSKYFIDQSQVLDIELNVVFKDVIKNAENVVGYIDKGAASNIVIAAPYNSFYDPENEKTNGNANVSSTSMLIELAKMLQASKAKNSNYTFIAYTDEDSLSKDSKWFNAAVASHSAFVINLNKVGRYNDDKKLLVEGYGTSPGWIETIKPLADNNLEVSLDTSLHAGRGSAYPATIPVLNFYTEIDESENKAAADNSKINYEGELNIAKFIYHLVQVADSKGKPAFTGNKELKSTPHQISKPVLAART